MATREQGIIPHLVVHDAAAALEFYKVGLGATETLRLPADDGKRILHAEMALNGARMFVRDDFPEHRPGHGEGQVMPPKTLRGTPVTLHLEVADCDEAVARAKAAGARITMAPMDAFWGARYAQIVDPFGHAWSFAHPLAQAQT